jgi:anti-sigma28 factor (negative regulator of flagellin synthesis)
VYGGAKIALSEISFDHSRVAKAVERKQPKRIERVNQLRGEMISGRYHVDSWRVVEKLVVANLICIALSPEPGIRE